ncbi:MAG: dihydroneopterin aldolase [Candidatus Kapaibacteriota bacterium]
MTRYHRTTTLSIVNAEYFGYHGVRPEEHSLGGRYQVDVDITYNASQAVMSDDLSDTINYEEVLFSVREHMQSDEPYDLIETLAFDIASAIMDTFDQAVQVTVRVRKLSVPIQQVLDYVQAETTLHRTA